MVLKLKHGLIGLVMFYLMRKIPERVIYRCEEPILEPEEEYEVRGVTPNVVFSCGQVVMNDEHIVYYGAADKHIGVAKTQLKKLKLSHQL